MKPSPNSSQTLKLCYYLRLMSFANYNLYSLHGILISSCHHSSTLIHHGFKHLRDRRLINLANFWIRLKPLLINVIVENQLCEKLDDNFCVWQIIICKKITKEFGNFLRNYVMKHKSIRVANLILIVMNLPMKLIKR